MLRPPFWAVGKLYLLLLLVLIAATSAFAQLETATVSGQVVDPSGLRMTGVQMRLIDIDRDAATSTATNASGLYTFPSVPPGRYRMEVIAAGFKVVNVTGMTVNTQDHLEQNFKLAVGSVSESVTVEGGAPVVDTESAAVSTVVDRQFAENLPMNGRSFQTLIDLTPGVVTVPSNAQDSGQFSVNGQRASSNYWMVDGVSANIGIGVGASASPGNGMGGTIGSFSTSGGTNSLVSVDAMQEFRIQTSTYAPEFGRTPGGQISIVTRSGTNQFHGTLFDYLRNDALDASDWFNGFTNSPPLQKAKERQNDFGGTFSGPIFKDRTFFFFSYEGLRLRLPVTTLTTVPCDDTCTIYGNARTAASGPLQPYFDGFPLPNGSEVFLACDPASDPTCPPSDQKPTGTAQFNKSYSNPSSLDAYSLRIDHKLANGLAIFARYNYSPSEIAQRGGSGFYPLSVVQRSRITTETGTVGTTWLVAPAVANEARFNYSRVNASGTWRQDNFGGAVPLPSLPLPNSVTTENAAFTFSISSLSDGPSLQVGEQAENVQRQVNVVDNLSVQCGSHSLKLGIDYRRLTPRTAPAKYSQLVFFLDIPSAQIGSTPEFGAIASAAPVTVLFRNLGVFAQDTWHVVPRLTLTYGLRWDVDFAPSSLNGPSIPSVMGYNLNDFSTLALASAGTPPFTTQYTNVAPRLGLAFEVFQKQNWQTVFRGGFGIFYDLASSETGTAIGLGDPPFGTFTPLSGSFPYPASQISPTPIPPATIASIAAFNPKLRLPYSLEWNIAWEQGLGREQSISASYIGASGRRLLQATDIQMPPTNSAVNGIFVDNTATSNYNALQLQFQRRLSRGLQGLASYSWSHSIDTGSAGSTALLSNIGIPGNNRDANRGPSDFDIRNALSVGVTYKIPTPRFDAFANALLDGWSVQSIIQARAAPPVDISDSHFFLPNGGIFADVRPDLVPGQPIYLFGPQCLSAFGSLCPGGKGLNSAAFTDPPTDPITGNPVRQGNVPRNFARGFGAAQWDFAIHRSFPIRELLRLELRVEMFNLLNHPNFGQPNGQFGTGSFGLSHATLGQYLNGGGSGSNVGGGAFSALYQTGEPRSLQFALILRF